MTHDELIEVVARAEYLADHTGLKNCWSWDDDGLDREHPGARDRYLRRATAAIAAVRAALGEPDEMMIRLGREAMRTDNIRDSSEQGRVRRIYTAALSASPLADPAARDDGMEGA